MRLDKIGSSLRNFAGELHALCCPKLYEIRITINNVEEFQKFRLEENFPSKQSFLDYMFRLALVALKEESQGQTVLLVRDRDEKFFDPSSFDTELRKINRAATGQTEARVHDAKSPVEFSLWDKAEYRQLMRLGEFLNYDDMGAFATEYYATYARYKAQGYRLISRSALSEIEIQVRRDPNL